MTEPAPTPIDILEGAAALIDRGWVRRYMSVDHNHYPVPVSCSSAACFCARGAMRRVADVADPDRGDRPERLDMLKRAESALVRAIAPERSPHLSAAEYIENWNDAVIGSAEAVSDTMRRAAQNLREECRV